MQVITLSFDGRNCFSIRGLIIPVNTNFGKIFINIRNRLMTLPNTYKTNPIFLPKEKRRREEPNLMREQNTVLG